jgi:cupin superfamily acireductone dioxygenase involved in methionine salvage
VDKISSLKNANGDATECHMAGTLRRMSFMQAACATSTTAVCWDPRYNTDSFKPLCQTRLINKKKILADAVGCESSGVQTKQLKRQFLLEHEHSVIEIMTYLNGMGLGF